MGSTLATGNNGYCVSYGPLDNIDTRGNVASTIAVGDETWTAGEILYVHPTVAGKLTKIKPEHAISVAIIVTLHASTGRLFVSIDRGVSHLDELHDVDSSDRQDKALLQWDVGTGKYKHTISNILTGEVILDVPASYPSVRLAIDSVLGRGKSADCTVTINVATGHVETEQLRYTGYDLSFITVVGNNTALNATTMTYVEDAGRYYLSVKDGKSPRMLGTWEYLVNVAASSALFVKGQNSVIYLGDDFTGLDVQGCRAFGRLLQCNSHMRYTDFTTTISDEYGILASGGSLDCYYLTSNKQVRVIGGIAKLINTSITIPTHASSYALYATGGANIQLNSYSIIGGIFAYGGSTISGIITGLSAAPAGTELTLLTAMNGSTISLHCNNVDLRASGSYGDLINVSTASQCNFSYDTVTLGRTSTGKIATVATGSTVTISKSIAATFTGGYSQTKNVITSAGLIIAP